MPLLLSFSACDAKYGWPNTSVRFSEFGSTLSKQGSGLLLILENGFLVIMTLTSFKISSILRCVFTLHELG